MCRYLVVNPLLLKASVNIFERMEIAEYIYEGVLEPSYKKPTRTDARRAGQSRKMRRETALSNTQSEMSESSDKRRKSYVDHPKDRSKKTFLIHDPGHLSYECQFLGDFGYKYFKIRTTKYQGHDPANKKKCNIY